MVRLEAQHEVDRCTPEQCQNQQGFHVTTADAWTQAQRRSPPLLRSSTADVNKLLSTLALIITVALFFRLQPRRPAAVRSCSAWLALASVVFINTSVKVLLSLSVALRCGEVNHSLWLVTRFAQHRANAPAQAQQPEPGVACNEHVRVS